MTLVRRSERATAERILDEALRAFGTRGYEATSLDDLGRTLGLAKQTILYWYPSKDALLAAVLDRAADEVTSRVGAALVGAGPGFARVEAVVKAGFRMAARHPALLSVLREAARLGPPVSTRLTERLGPLVEAGSNWLEAEMRAGRMRRHDPHLLLLSAWSLVTGLSGDPELLRAFGEEPTLAGHVRRRDQLIELLRAALEA
jgi:AcrR family transcriptional regulator